MGNKGSRMERELVNELWDLGLTVIRSPASGARRKQPQPDLVFSDGETICSVECKSSKDGPIYIEKREIKDLLEFSKGFGSVALLGIRYNRCDWRLVDPCFLKDTGGKNFRMDKDVALEHGKKPKFFSS